MAYVLVVNGRVATPPCNIPGPTGDWVEVYNEELYNQVDPWSSEEFVVQDGMLVYAPTDSQLAEEEMDDLMRKLSNTDYIASKIAEGAATREDYAEQIAQRAEWRSRINELEEIISRG